VQLARALTLIVWLAAGFAACTRVEPADASPDVSVGADGFGGEAQGGSGSAAGEAGEQQGGTGISSAGAPGAIELGIWPTFARSAQGDAEAVLASIAALSAGSSALPVYERWDALSGATGTPRVITWDRLDAMFAPYRERGKGLALCIGIVDRTSPAWPFAGTLDSEDARAAIRSTIDEVFGRYGPQLNHLCFGYEVDRYLAEASSAAEQELLEFLKHAIAHAATYAEEYPNTALGVAVTLAGAGQDALLADLTQGAKRIDEVIAVYDPLGEDAALEPPTAIADELTAAFEVLQGLEGGPKPLVLFEAGYPSGASAGSSEGEQAAYYEALFSALEEHTSQVSFVGLFGLGDRSAPDCEMEALAFGVPQAEERALARCSMGLRAETGEPKLAWSSVMRAISQYR
jgi:hypothetical protein